MYGALNRKGEEMAKRIRHRRTHYLIKRQLQLRYTLAIVLTLLVVMATTGAGLYLGMRASVIENLSKFRVSQDLENAKRISEYESTRYQKGDYRIDKTFREAELLSERERVALADAFRAVNRSLLPKVTLVMLLIFLGGIILSHQIAGPLYRFEESAKAIAGGDLRAKFIVRKSDQAQETAVALERMAEALRSDIGRIKETGKAIENAASNADRLKGAVKELNAILGKYKT